MKAKEKFEGFEVVGKTEIPMKQKYDGLKEVIKKADFGEEILVDPEFFYPQANSTKAMAYTRTAIQQFGRFRDDFRIIARSHFGKLRIWKVEK